MRPGMQPHRSQSLEAHQRHAAAEHAEAAQLAHILIDALAAQISNQLAERLPAVETNGSPWLTFDAACPYLGLSKDALYKLTAARAIPCRKKLGGQGLRFHRDELDAWMHDTYPRL